MKKRYEAPNVEIVKFEYSDQVVAQSAQSAKCDIVWINFKVNGECSDPVAHKVEN